MKQRLTEKALLTFEEKLRANPFSKKAAQQMTFGPSRLHSELFELNRDAENEFAKSQDYTLSLQAMTPAFQRSNNQWPRWRQQRFVENVLAGFRTTLSLYGVEADVSMDMPTHTYLLDGLQRTTAWIAFLTDVLPVYGGYYFSELRTPRIMKSVRMGLDIHVFKSHVDACRFYIEMNRGITHSDADIAVAEQFLNDHG